MPFMRASARSDTGRTSWPSNTADLARATRETAMYKYLHATLKSEHYRKMLEDAADEHVGRREDELARSQYAS